MVNLVFVESREGNTGADDPSTLGGGETDQHLIGPESGIVHTARAVDRGRRGPMVRHSSMA